MVEFGRVGYVAQRDKMLGKLDERSTKMIMVGYASKHSGDIYCMYNPGTKHIILLQNVKWADWTNKNPTSNTELFSKFEEEDKVPGVDETYVISTTESEKNASVREISKEGECEGVPNKNSSEMSVPQVSMPRSVQQY